MTEVSFTTKDQAIQSLSLEYHRWFDLVQSITPTQAKSILYDNRTIKDDLAHLWEWQRISTSRLKGATLNQAPIFDWVPKRFADDIDSHTQSYNDYIFKLNQKLPWDKVRTNWSNNFSELLKLTHQISEPAYLDKNLFPWLRGYRLMAVLEGTFNHHHTDHWPNIKSWYNQHKQLKIKQ